MLYTDATVKPAFDPSVVTRPRVAYYDSVRGAKVLAGVLGVALGLLPVVPPEHLHEEEDHGHARIVIHRHLKPHDVLERHRDGSRVDDHDSPVLTLGMNYNVPAPPFIAAPIKIATAWVEPPPPRRAFRAFVDLDVLIHGPPRAPTPLRAPPFTPAP
jgi:hypothetical protein